MSIRYIVIAFCLVSGLNAQMCAPKAAMMEDGSAIGPRPSEVSHDNTARSLVEVAIEEIKAANTKVTAVIEGFNGACKEYNLLSTTTAGERAEVVKRVQEVIHY